MKILCRGFALEGVDLIESPSIKREILGLLEEKLKELNEGIFDEKI
jgi:hypothetical protein